MSHIFLTKNFTEEGATKYFAIDSDKIETLRVSDTYDQFGQQISNSDAGDYSLENSASNAKADCVKAIEEKFEITNVLLNDNELASFNGIDTDDFSNYVEDEDGVIDAEDEYNKNLDLIIEINNFIDKWREENETFTEVKGFTFWNGHNWQTITTSFDNGEPTHRIVDDKTIAAELNKAIEEKEFEGEGFGCKIYRGNGYVVVDSFWNGTWSQFEIVPVSEYEAEQNTSKDYNY